MNKQLVALTTTIVSLLLLGVAGNRSEAFTIDEMRSWDRSYTYFHGGYIQHNAYVKTSEAYSQVKWYVDGALRDTSGGDGEETEAWFCPDPVSGSISGATYEIKAVAEPLEGEASASPSYTITVYEPIIRSGTGTNTGVYGSSKLSRQYYSHPSIIIDCSVNASNSTGQDTLGFYRFQHEIKWTIDGAEFTRDDFREPQQWSKINKNGGTYNACSCISLDVGDGDSGQEYDSKAYVRLTVKKDLGGDIIVTDEWLVENTASFQRIFD